MCRPLTFLPSSSSSSASAFAQVRFNSSSTSSFSPADISTNAPEILPDRDTDILKDAATNTVDAPWYIGYLNEQLGGFGWGPSSTVQWLFEHIHVYAGTSMAVSIILTAAAIRIFTFPLVVKASDTAAKMQRLKPIMDPIQAKMKEAMNQKDQLEMARCQREMSKLRREHGVKLRRTMYPLIQIPIGFGSWRVIRNMAFLPIPGMSSAGLLWFPNLCIPDPYFVLPLATGFLQHMSIRVCNVTHE